jgi:hypothetical protein
MDRKKWKKGRKYEWKEDGERKKKTKEKLTIEIMIE